MRLMIVESPNKVRKISEYLGSEWKVAASVGHIRDLPAKEMGVVPPYFKPTYVVSHEKKKVVSRLKALCRDASEVYLATDPDREGEAIAWHLAEELNLKNPIRVSFGEITKDAIKKALQSPGKIDSNLVSAQEGRRVLDRIVGYTISPILSELAMTPLSAGRVQSPAVKLVVLREREIEKFRKRTFFLPQADLGDGLILSLSPKNWCEDGKHIFEKEMAEKIIEHNNLVILGNETKDQESKAPAPFTTSGLVQAASKYLKFSTKDTMKLAQSLFEAGLITYHRTDNPNFSDDGYEKVASFAREKGLPVNSIREKWPAKEGAQEGHEAIRPSSIELEQVAIGENENALYTLIRERTLASTIERAIDTVITITAETESLVAVDQYTQKALYQATAKSEKRAGWRNIFSIEKPTRPNKTISSSLTPGDKVTPEMTIEVKTTEPPKRFTEGELVSALEKLGIGRPSTYGSIIENIKKRGYIEEKKRGKGKGYISPSTVGCQLVDSLAPMSFMNFDFTKTLELHLDGIAEGKTRYLDLVKALHDNIESEKAKVSISPLIPVAACPKCGAQLKQLFSKKNKSHFWVHVEETDNCSQFISDKENKPVG